MRSTIFTCFLLVAGAYSMPQADIVPSQERIVDLWLRDAIAQASRWIRENNLDPAIIETHKFDLTFFDEIVSAVGIVEDLKFTGLSNILYEDISFNIILNRLDFNLIIPELSLSIGNFKARGQYLVSGGDGEIRGSLTINNVRLRGNAILRIFFNPIFVSVVNINVEFSIANIDSDLTVGWKCLGCLVPRDVSNCANNLWAVTIPGLLDTFANEINTIIGEWIRTTVNNIQG